MTRIREEEEVSKFGKKFFAYMPVYIRHIILHIDKHSTHETDLPTSEHAQDKRQCITGLKARHCTASVCLTHMQQDMQITFTKITI